MSGLKVGGWVLGELGVYTFFVLSGFIIMRQSAGAFGQPGAIGVFIRRRIVRIVPLYWLVTIYLSTGRSADVIGPHGLNVFRTLFFIPYFARDTGIMMPITGVGWTLNYEMFFYAIFAVCLAFPKRIGVSVLLSILIMFVALGKIINPYQLQPTTLLTFYASQRLIPFILGVLLGLFEKRMPSLIWPKSLPSPAWFLLVLAGILLFVSRSVDFGSVGKVWALHDGMTRTGMLATVVTVLCIMAGTRSRSGWIDTLLVKLGDASYSTYLVHAPLLYSGNILFEKYVSKSQHHAYIWLPLAIVVCHIFAWLIYICLEKPLTFGANWIIKAIVMLRNQRIAVIHRG